MKNILFAVFIIALVVLFGTWPLAIIAKVFNYLRIIFEWLSNFLNIFGWNGLI